MEKKIELGQFYTIENPFKLKAFLTWYDSIPEYKKETLLEPFTGSNNILKLIAQTPIRNLFSNDKGWKAYDISPPEINAYPEVEIEQRDTIKDFPKGYYVGITNPPYLAKNSATRRGIEFLDKNYDDLYQIALDKMLDNLEYVAVIIPESFITSTFDKSRLQKFISLTTKMFDDTEVPVCLALFGPEKTTDFEVYQNDVFLGMYNDLKENSIEKKNKYNWKFNDPQGFLGIKAIDDTNKESIRFIMGDEIESEKIKVSSRAFSRISLDLELSKKEQKELIKEANRILKIYRKETKDILMTSFKGLRKDGKYRRRIDFKTVREILNQALSNIIENR